MRLSGIILAALATLCVSFASAPAAKATVLGSPVASIEAANSVEPVSYYKRRYYDDCYRPNYGRYRKHEYKHGGYHRRSYRHKQYSDYDYPYRKHYRRHHRNDDDYDDYDD